MSSLSPFGSKTFDSNTLAPDQVAKYVRERSKHFAQRCNTAVAFQKSPNAKLVADVLFRACDSNGDYKHTCAPTLLEAEHMLRAMRQQALFRASHRPDADLRLAVAVDAMYFGSTLGLYNGVRFGEVINDNMESILFFAPWTIVKYIGSCMAPFLQGPSAFCGDALDAIKHVCTQSSPAKGATPEQARTQLWQALGRNARYACDGLVVSALLVRRAYRFAVNLTCAALLGVAGASGAFALRVLLLTTVYSRPFANAAAGVDSFCGHAWPFLHSIAQWSQSNELIFERMRFGMGHAIEKYRSDLRLFCEWKDLANVITTALVSLNHHDSPKDNEAKVQPAPSAASKTAWKFDHIIAFEREVNIWIKRLESLADTLASDYRGACIRDFHFDPAFSRTLLELGYDVREWTQITTWEAKGREAAQNMGPRTSDSEWLHKHYRAINKECFITEPAKDAVSSPSLYARGAEEFEEAFRSTRYFAKLLPLPLESGLGPQANKAQNRPRLKVKMQAAFDKFSKACAGAADRKDALNQDLIMFAIDVVNAEAGCDLLLPHINNYLDEIKG